jgi:prepilin-type N-terminal cleavage/methylation domain-containing protein
VTTLVTRATDERGFTLAEVLLATAIILIGLVAVATGFQFATSGVATGRGETVAVFLAEQRLEQLKTTAMTDYDSIAAGTTTEYCQATNIGVTSSNCQGAAITNAPAYTRVTTVTINPGGTGCTGAPLLCKRIHVNVTYRPVTTRGDASQTRTVDVYAVVTPRS